MIELKLPELGENIETAEVSRVLVGVGDLVKAGQSVLELESEKASFPLPCPNPGRVAKIRVKAGDTVSIGQTVLEIDESGAASARTDGQKPTADGKPKKGAEPKEPARRDAPSPSAKVAAKDGEPSRQAPATTQHEEAASDQESPVAAGPATRHLARELGVDLSEVPGSERGGRITREDVKAYVKQRLAEPAAPARAGADAALPLPDFSRWGPVRREPMNKIARTSAQRLSLAWRTIPHVTQHDVADVAPLEQARVRFNEEHRDAAPKITMTALAIRAAVAALKTFPHFNSSLDPRTEELIVKDYYHIGVAVDTEHGLLVPVVRDADRKSLVEIAAELTELADKARARSLAPKDMEGGTFTITNLGGIGGSYFTPIINAPEVAILGIGRAEASSRRKRAGTKRLLLPLSLSYDHRVINGAEGARFLRRIASSLADPFLLLAQS